MSSDSSLQLQSEGAAVADLAAPTELRQLQKDISAYMLGGPVEAASEHVRSAKFSGLAVYRDSINSSYVAALAATFPVLGRLIGEQPFRALLRRFLQARLVALNRYNQAHELSLDDVAAQLPKFIAQFPALQQWPWFADIARLEWQIDVSRRRYRPLQTSANPLDGIPEERICFTWAAGVMLLCSAYPVSHIWQDALRDNESGVEGQSQSGSVFDLGGELLLIDARPGEKLLQFIELPQWQLMSLLRVTPNWEACCEQLLEREQTDLAESLAVLLAQGWLQIGASS